MEEKIAYHLLDSPSQDPFVVLKEGRYYYVESTPSGICMRVAQSLFDLRHVERHQVWLAPPTGPMSKEIWAPELHEIDGHWYIYFAASDGRNETHRMWVLKSSESDPLGPYHLDEHPLNTNGWAIDGTVIYDRRKGVRYFVWSGWPGSVNGQQNLYIARMETPTTLEPTKHLLIEPDQAWERRAMPICEGPQMLEHNDRTYLVYSASGSWTEHYCLGLLIFRGGDAEMTDAAAWRKIGPVFCSSPHGWGVGHCGFVTDADGVTWMLYHAKTTRRYGWTDREVRFDVGHFIISDLTRDVHEGPSATHRLVCA